jgi:hypothetical protein
MKRLKQTKGPSSPDQTVRDLYLFSGNGKQIIFRPRADTDDVDFIHVALFYSPSPLPLPTGSTWLPLLSLPFRGEVLNSSPFKGEVERGMGDLVVPEFAYPADHNLPHPHPNPPLEEEGILKLGPKPPAERV